jgi:hypothetical protein
LAHDVWNPAGARCYDAAPPLVYSTIRLLNTIIKPLRLSAKGQRNLGYLLEAV